MTKKTLRSFAIATVIAAALVGPAVAQEADDLGDMLGAETVTDESLGKANGKEMISLNNADLESVNGNNQANNSVTGNATIAPGALTDFSGTAAVVMNTGNNSTVQVSQQIIFNLY